MIGARSSQENRYARLINEGDQVKESVDEANWRMVLKEGVLSIANVIGLCPVLYAVQSDSNPQLK